MGNASTSAAWTAAPLDECLDKLGTCESTVSECETRTFILEAQIALLRHPEVVIGLACGVAVFLLLGLLRCCWHIRVGAVPGAFPWDLFPGWVLRRAWRVARWPVVQVGSRLFGPQMAEGVAGVLDEVAVSPDVVAPVYATIRRLSPPSAACRPGPSWACSGPTSLPLLVTCRLLRRRRRPSRLCITARRRGRCRLCQRGPCVARLGGPPLRLGSGSILTPAI